MTSGAARAMISMASPPKIPGDVSASKTDLLPVKKIISLNG